MEIYVLIFLVLFFHVNCSIATLRPKRDLNIAIKHVTYKEINIMKCLAKQINSVENLRYDLRIILTTNHCIFLMSFNIVTETHYAFIISALRLNVLAFVRLQVDATHSGGPKTSKNVDYSTKLECASQVAKIIL